MTQQEATSYISLHLQPAIDPALSDDDLAALLTQSKRADSSSRAPSDPDWEPTYDLASAIADGWTLKAGKAAGDYDFKDSNLQLTRSQVHAHCLGMASQWARRCGGSVRITSDLKSDSSERIWTDD